MDLKIKDIVEWLQVSEKTVYRWIKEKKIPCYKINHQYRFNRSEINEWILSNKIELSSKLINDSFAVKATNFYDLLTKGGIYRDIDGSNSKDILHNAIQKIHTPKEISKDEIYNAIINREELMTTAIGKGIALPHPRSPIVTNVQEASVSVCYLKNPVNFNALDGVPVHTLFIILTFSPRRHLEVLAKISSLCQIDSFVTMLKAKVSAEELLNFIKAKELEWYKQETPLNG